MVIVPLVAPQLAAVGVTTTAVGPLLLLIVVLVENVHPLTSFTVMVCGPADTFVKVCANPESSIGAAPSNT